MAAAGNISFLGFLETQPADRLDALYRSRWTVCALLRSLPPLARYAVLRLLHVEAPLSAAALRSWARPAAAAAQEGALAILTRLRVLVPAPGGVTLHPAVRRHLGDGLYDVRGEAEAELPERLRPLLPSDAQLDAQARAKWERLLLFLVGEEAAPEPEAGSECVPGREAVPAPLAHRARRLDVAALLADAGLTWSEGEAAAAAGLSPPADSEARVIRADAGFRFLLLPRPAQLWTLLQSYVAAAEARGDEPSAVLALLLRLSFLPSAVPQAARADGPTRRLLGDLATLGVAHVIGEEAGPAPGDSARLWYAVTPLAASVAAGLAGGGGGGGRAPGVGFVIVETNFRVYAYTNSRVELAILQFFCRPELLLPNLFVGALTRDSVAAALRNGVSGQQVVSYLEAHAHPRVASRPCPLPDTVAAQILLWAADTARLRGEPATLYDGFPGEEAYERARKHAMGQDALLWESREQRAFVARRDVADSMRAFFAASRAEGFVT